MRRFVTAVSFGLTILLGLAGSVGVWAQSVEEDQGTISVAGMSPAEIEALYPDPENAPIVHPIPNYPVVVDGVRYQPEEISRFNGRALRFIWDKKSAAEGVIYAFTTAQGLERYLKEQWNWSPSAKPPTAGSSATLAEPSAIIGPESVDPYWTLFYEHDGFDGNSIRLEPGACFGDLTSWPAGWNDRISSLKVATAASWTVLYEDIMMSGSQHWEQSGVERPSLSPFGWNDRASSVCALQ
ncbi:MAG: hypothetical protein M0Z94_09690 [Dehalococcoidales bacterium]|nr:hypothetical protein [Dehalococcoidales bacterium]